MTDQEKPLHIVELQSSNVKRLRAVRVRPEDGAPLVLIGGENGQGKSSLLDSIEMALAGARSIPLEPVRHGARQADIELGLGGPDGVPEFKVERTFTAKGTELVVRDADGVPLASPQRLLDKMCAKVAFDPLEFMRMDTPKQDALLKKMLGLDFSDIERKRVVAYEKRTKVNAEVERLETLLKEFDADVETAPDELVDVAALSEKIQAHTNEVGGRETLAALILSDTERLEEQNAEIEAAERELERLKKRRDTQRDAILERQKRMPPPPPPIDDVRAQLKNAESTNNKVRAKREWKKTEEALSAAETEACNLNVAIKNLDKEKDERLAAAKFPIPGLGFDDAGPTFNGVPLAQASQAEQLRVSVAIGAAQNPRVRVMLVREGSRLDKKSLALLAELAAETGFQCWVERVSDGDPGAIIIEDGLLKEQPVHATAPTNGAAVAP